MGASGPSGQDNGGSRESNKKARKDTEVSAYEREIEKQKAAEKAQKKNTTRKSTDDPRNTNRENAAVSNYTSLTKDDAVKIKQSKEKVKKATGKSKLDNYEIPKSDAPGVIGATLNLTQPFRQKSFEVNREYYQKNVVGKENYKDTFDDYERYIKGRSEGKLDAMGRPITSTGGRDSKVTEAPKETVKTSILSQPVEAETKVETFKEEKKEDKYDVRKIKKKGRRKNILTSSKGVTTVSDDYSLGKKSLLGTV
jgi:hypothetical protein|tara:strand:+ start:128 stop:886 length:759 start_codon:yes stop_codon:yes gene_type:complete